MGIVGRIFSTSLIALKTFFKNKIENPYKRIGYISILLVIGLMIFKGRYSGLGTNLIDLSFYGNVTYYDWFLKLIFTVVTLSTNDDRFRSLWWASNDSSSYYMYFCLFS